MDFWDQLLRLDFHGAPRCAWEGLGDNLRLLESVLVPLGRYAKRVSCLQCGCNHKVFDGEEEGMLRAVCQCDECACGDILLPKLQVEMLTVDVRKLPGLLGGCLPMEPRLYPTPYSMTKSWRLGLITMCQGGLSGSLVVCFSAKNFDLNNAVLGVCERDLGPTVFVCRTENADSLEKRLPQESRVVDFNDVWTLGSDGFEAGKAIRRIVSGWDDDAPIPVTNPLDEKFVFRKSGSSWVVVFDSAASFHIMDCLGARYIDYLLHHPNDPISCFDLEVAVCPEKGSARGETSIQANAGPKAVRDMLRTLSSLRAERDEAADEGRLNQVSSIDHEIESLEEAVRNAGNQETSDSGERSRHNVRKAIKAVKDKLSKGARQEKQFLRHLEDMLSTGYNCSYKSPNGRIWR